MPSRTSDQPIPARTTSPGLVLPLTEIDRTMISQVGGKAANLGELTQAGFAVPQGFCVTTEAYREVVEQAELDRLLADAGAAHGGDDLAARGPGADRQCPGARAHPAARSSTPTRPWASTAPWSRSGRPRPPRTCRSPASPGSRTPTSACVGAEQVLDAVRRCWASLWTDRAVAYRGTQQIDHRSARLAVVVQAMVHSETAGVLFTANPVTGTPAGGRDRREPGARRGGGVRRRHPRPPRGRHRNRPGAGEPGRGQGSRDPRSARWRHRADRRDRRPTSCA